MEKLTLYHGTTKDKVDSILKEGLKSPNWYMLATNFGSALYHANATKENEAVVIEIQLTIPKNDDDFLWKGYPILYPEYKHDNSDISWFALEQIIEPENIKKIHTVSYDSYLEQKNNGFDDLKDYKTSVKNINKKLKFQLK